MSKKEAKRAINRSVIGLTLALDFFCLFDCVKDSNKFVINREGTNLSTENKKEESIYIKSSEELDQYIPNYPTFSEIRKVLNSNKNLLAEDKNNILEVIDKIEEKIPFIDTRTLYENCASLKITRNATKKNDAGSFNPFKKRINLKTTEKKVFTHEVLHMNNSLVFYASDGNRVIKKFNVDDNDYSFLKEGLNEWLNQYLFDYCGGSYQKEVNDIKLFQFICHLTDDELVKVYNQGNYSDIISNLAISDLEKQELVRICKKSYECYFDDNAENITSNEFIKKYEILLKACINSRKDEPLSSNEYAIAILLRDSYTQYQSTFPNECSIIEETIENEVIDKIKSYNKNIIFNNDNDEAITYFDLNNLYLIYNSFGTGCFQYIIGEKYLFNGKVQYHVEMDSFMEAFVNTNLLVQDEQSLEIIPIMYLIENFGDNKEIYTYEDICNMHRMITHKDKKVKEKIR